MRSAETVPAVEEPEPPAPGRSRRRHVVIAAAAGGALLVAVVIAAFVLGWVAVARPAGPTQAEVDATVKHGLEQAQEQQRTAPADAAVAFRQIAPSLVTVTARTATGTSLGAGVVVNAAGSVLTALHVVAGGEQIQVAFTDGTVSSAHVTAAQAEKDVAVLAVDRLPTVVVPAVLAGPPAIGDPVFAVGNPLGFAASLSAGVVSGNDRSIATPQGPTLAGLIQFDAAVNPGNSGGPLLNRAGQVVGIVTGLANPAKQDFFVGIGFAVPITAAGGVAGGPQQ